MERLPKSATLLCRKSTFDSILSRASMPTGITILAFGYISTLLGTRKIVLPCEGPLTVSSVLAELKTRYPSFSQYVGEVNDVEESLLILLEDETAGPESIVHSGDKLILVTPMSGG